MILAWASPFNSLFKGCFQLLPTFFCIFKGVCIGLPYMQGWMIGPSCIICGYSCSPANIDNWTNVGLMLVERHVFAGCMWCPKALPVFYTLRRLYLSCVILFPRELDIWGEGGGGGGASKNRKMFVATKVKKSAEKIWQAWPKMGYVDQKKNMINMINQQNGNVQSRDGIWQNLIFPFFNET